MRENTKQQLIHAFWGLLITFFLSAFALIVLQVVKTLRGYNA